MAKNVMKMLKPSPTLGRNAFDLSHRNVFAANAGELLPCCCIETVPNDKITIRPADLLRAAPLVTSPFLRAKQHVDFWFVPYQALWSRWNDFITSRSEPSSSALKDFAFVPHTSLKSLLSTVDGVIGTQKDIVGQDYRLGAARLLDLLGYPSFPLYDQATGGSTMDLTDFTDSKVNLFRLAAYNFIWYKEYRQKYYDDGTYILGGVANVASLFNFDELPCDIEANADLISYMNPAVIQAMSQLRYRCWKKDLFTGILPSTQFGNVSTVLSSPTKIFSKPISESQHLPLYTGLTTPDEKHPVYEVSGTYYDAGLQTGSPSFDILALRKSEAIQKWRENALRAGNQIEDNYEAHFGSKPHSHLISHPTFIGSYDAPLNISDVDATAQTGNVVNGTVGSIAGKGISTLGDHELKFETNDFGVIMGIFSILPETEYMSYGIDRNNQLLEQFDFFMPEFENLGLEAVSSYTFMTYKTMSPGNIRPIYGYAPRYFGYKQVLDKVHSGFAPTQGYHHWVTPHYKASLSVYGSASPLQVLYVDPSILDTVFASSVINERQFIVDMFNDITAIRSMSVSGMPSY